MKTRLTIILFLLLCWMPAQAESPAADGIVHVVIIWLKEPGNVEHREVIVSGTKKLRDIPGVLDLRVGQVVPSDREVVDSSYDVAIYLRFANKEDLNSYLVHPIHHNTVKEEFLPVIDRYKVFDFLDQ